MVQYAYTPDNEYSELKKSHLFIVGISNKIKSEIEPHHFYLISLHGITECICQAEVQVRSDPGQVQKVQGPKTWTLAILNYKKLCPCVCV